MIVKEYRIIDLGTSTRPFKVIRFYHPEGLGKPCDGGYQTYEMAQSAIEEYKTQDTKRSANPKA